MIRFSTRYAAIVVATVAMLIPLSAQADESPHGKATATASPGVRTETDAEIDAMCRPYFHDACSEALGRWLPGFSAGFGSDWSARATHVSQRDHFVYEGERDDHLSVLQSIGPRDGTRFVFGTAGPPRGEVVYDPTHHIAFYDVGCCSWRAFVAAAGTPAPPKSVANRDLRNLATARGARLWMTPEEIRGIYGNATFRALPGLKGVSVLSYSAVIPPTPQVYSPCVQEQNFFFRTNRLILIQLVNAC
jgi:hypothetical protein